MNDIQKQVFITFKSNLAGLPSFSRLVMYEIFEYIDYASGTISIKSLDVLARANFQVDSLRGRQKETINGDTIRNAFRTIKKAKPDHFKFTTANQRIVIEMPFLRELYQSIYKEKEDAASVLASDVAAVKTLTESSELINVDPLLAEDVAGVLAAASFNDAINTHAKNKQTKTNKNTQTDGVVELFSQTEKLLIADDFYPSDAIINHALSKGLTKVIDASEIKKFILYNQAISSVRVDHNPLFLRWLERDAEHTEKRKKITHSQQTWSTQHERHSHPRNTVVITGEYTEGFGCRADNEEQHQMVVDSVDQSLWQTIPYQTRCPR